MAEIGDIDEDNFPTQDSYQFVDRPVDYAVNVNKILDATQFKHIKDSFIPHDYIAYYYLDSNNRLNVTDKNYQQTNILIWEINSNSPVYRTGTINVKDSISEIVACEIGPVSISDRFSATTSMFPLTSNSKYNQKIGILIKEFQAQSCISQSATRYHFMLKRKPIILDAIYQVTAAKQLSYPTFIPLNKGIYKFSKPISRTDSITMQITCPFAPLYFDKENYEVTVTIATNPITLTFSADPGIFYNEIVISEFTTGDPVADKATIDSVNRTFVSDQIDSTATYQYTRTSGTTIQLNVSSVGLDNSVPVVTAYVFVGFNFQTCLKLYGRVIE